VNIDALVARLAQVPGVVAVTLGGSRARGEVRPDSDWDFGLYYRGGIDTAVIRDLGYRGHVVEPGEWGRLVNGGAWLEIAGERVDLLYRDLDVVEYWLAETREGRFEIDEVAGHVAGLPTYVLAGELALGQVLHGTLPRPSFPDALRREAPPRWQGQAAFALLVAEGHAARGDAVACAGLLARAAMAAAQARLAERGEWALNEKGLIARAGLRETGTILAAAGTTAEAMTRSVDRMRRLLGLARPEGMRFDQVVGR
jgi:predicted nucleotidyltransferase